jgi:FAD/FMN-containing dehydrogenase
MEKNVSLSLDGALGELLPKDQWTTDPELLKTYAKDWTKHYTPNASAVLFPRSTTDVQKIVRWARAGHIALVPSGGRTGLSAAAFATRGEVIVSFEKMNRVLEFDPFDQTLRCEPGVITEQIQNLALEKGFYFPIDFASRGSSQIGGNVATNAGGIKVIRYGLIRDWIAGLTVVTGTGEVLELNNSLVKNATGYDLRQLFIGSEGTLGFITEVTLRLTRPPSDLQVVVVGLPNLDAIMDVFLRFRKAFDLVAFEMFTDLALKYITEQGHGQPPFATSCPFYVLIEVEKGRPAGGTGRDSVGANADPTADPTVERLLSLIEAAMADGVILDGVLAQNDRQAKDLWALRENITESTSHKLPYKNDISVRISKVPEFLRRMTEILSADYPDFEVVWFGHIGDGNLHVNILKPDGMSSADFMTRCHQVDKDMMGMIRDLRGSVSAEHGVGLVKKPFLYMTRSEPEIALMRKIKIAFDPDGILNPGKIFDL